MLSVRRSSDKGLETLVDVMMVNKIDRPNATPIGPFVLSLTFKVWLLRVYLLTTSLFCTKGWEGL